MRKFVRPGRVMLVLGLGAVLVAGLVALSTPTAEAKGRCICPKVYAPVECKGGKVFPNQCEADCRRAKDCVPLGTL